MPSLLLPLLRRLITATAALTAAAEAATIPARAAGGPDLPVTVLHWFPYPSWVENLAVRRTGEILATRLDAPALYQVDPDTGAAAEVAAWDAGAWAGALGIAEAAEDVFYVVLAAPFEEGTFVRTRGVGSLFRVDMSTFALSSGPAGGVASNATVTRVADIPEADFLNGLAALDDDDGAHVIVSDARNGVAYAVDVRTGAHRVAADDPLMKATALLDAGDPPPPTLLGCNGLQVRGGYLYWTNTAAGVLARIPLGRDGVARPGARGEVVATGLARADDFALRGGSGGDGDGWAFVAQNQFDTLSVAAVPGAGRGGAVAVAAARPLAGGRTSAVLAGVSSARFGRRAGDCDRLYLSTSGALALPINGSVTVAGTISYVDIDF